MQPIHTYLAYGLHIMSELSLPELAPAHGTPDVLIRVDPNPYVESASSDRQSSSFWRKIDRQEAEFAHGGYGRFLVCAGHTIDVALAPEADLSLVRRALVGQAMANLLYQRGNLVLHASAVEVNGGAIAFIGTSGAGKSSLAAVMYQRGHSVLADDVVSIDLAASEQALVASAFPHLKISEDVATTLDLDRERLARIHPLLAEYDFHLSNGDAGRAVPLAHLFILVEDLPVWSQPLAPRSAFVELMRHSLPVRFGHAGDTLHLQQTATVVSLAPVSLLRRAEDASTLHDVARNIEGSLATLPSG